MGSSDNQDQRDDIKLTLYDLMVYEDMTDEQRARIPEWLRSKADAKLAEMIGDAASPMANAVGQLMKADAAQPQSVLGDTIKKLQAVDQPRLDSMQGALGSLIKTLRGIDPSKLGISIPRLTVEEAEYFSEHATELERDMRKKEFKESSAEANKRIARRLQDFRTNAEGYFGDFTQEQAAALFGMSTSTLGTREQGVKPIPAGEVVVMSSWYGIRPEIVVSPLEGDDLKREAELLSAFYKLDPDMQELMLAIMLKYIKGSNS